MVSAIWKGLKNSGNLTIWLEAQKQPSFKATGTLKMKEFAPRMSIFFPLRVAPWFSSDTCSLGNDNEKGNF